MNESAALYARVSTLQQEQEATIESQVAALEAYAQQHGYQLRPEYYFLDQAVSGAKLMRPALDRLRDRAAEGAFATVLCLSPDRLARQYAHQWVLLDELQRVGVKILFVNQPPLSDDPQSQLLLGIQGLFSEYERAMITERLRRGRLYRLRQGQAVSPQPAYGYRYVPASGTRAGHWEIEALEAAVVRQIYDWYTGPEHLTIWAIVQRLKQLGSAAPVRGQQWGYSTVRHILCQPAYTGRAYYNRTQTQPETTGRPRKCGRGHTLHPDHPARPCTEWITFAVPSVLSQDVWQRAAERLATNQQFAARNNKRFFYPLRSLLVCGTCGFTLVGRSSHGGYTSYYCPNGGTRRQAGVPAHSCNIADRVITPLVWQAIGDLLRHPALLEDAWQSQDAVQPAEPDEAERLQARLRALERQWARVLDAFQNELIDKAELAQRKERLDQERQSLQQRLQELTRLARQQQAKTQMLQDFAAFCHDIESALDSPTPEVQQEVFRLLIDHVVVEPDAIVIKHVIPTDDDCRLLLRRRNSRIHGRRRLFRRRSVGFRVGLVVENERPLNFPKRWG